MNEKEYPLENFISYNEINTKFWKSILLSIFAAVITILFISSINENNTSTVYVLFIGILPVLYSIEVDGIWGIFTGFLSSILFCLSAQLDTYEIILNISANTIQYAILWALLKSEKTSCKVSYIFENRKPHINNYNCAMLFVGLLYIILNIMLNDISVIFIFASIVCLIILQRGIKENNIKIFTYSIAIYMLPSLIGALFNSIYYFDNVNTVQLILTWTLSNFILFSSFGYILLIAIRNNVQKNNNEPKIKIVTIMFYIATLIWNLLFYGMYIIKFLNPNTISYLFPWAVGNIFFISNLLLSQKPEIIENGANMFDWHENRAIVAEKNTQMLTVIISFLLPMLTRNFGTIPTNLAIVFMMNITVAIVSLGIIWVPHSSVHTMELIKNIKTIGHLFTLSLLLLAIFMIINHYFLK